MYQDKDESNLVSLYESIYIESPLSYEFDGIDDDDDSHFSDHYDGKKPEVNYGNELYYGRNVEWVGESGKTIKVSSEDISSREDNITNNSKVKAVRDYILSDDTEDRVRLDTPLAQILIIDRDDIADTQRAYASDTLQQDYRIDSPFTTGDEEVDNFLYMELDEFCEEVGIDSDYVNEDYTPNIEAIREYIDDEEDISSTIDEINETFQRVKDNLNEAETDSDGDFGRTWAIIRDGNHRAWGAILSGESDIFVSPLAYHDDDLKSIRHMLI